MAVLILCLLLIAVGGIVWGLRRSTNPAALWAWGWVVFAAIAGFIALQAELAWGPSVANLVSPLLPGFLLAGALAYADRRVPAWLLPAALAAGAIRWILAGTALPQAGHLIGIVVEPAAELGAALLVWQVSRRPGATLAQHLLAPAFVAIAALDTVTALAAFRGIEMPTPVVIGWPLVGFITLGLQISASGQRSREMRALLQREGEEARQALRESEQRFQVLAEHSTDLIAEIDRSGSLVYISPSVETMMGYRPADLLGKMGSDWTHPDDAEPAVVKLRETLRTQGRASVLARCRHRDGSWRWIESEMCGFRGPQGDVRVVAIGRDVTAREEQEQSLRRSHETLEQRVEDRNAQLLEAVRELEKEVAARRLAEAELRASRERYRNVSELSSDFSFGFRVRRDGSLEPEWITQAFTRLTGFTLEEIGEGGWRSLLKPEHWDTARAELARALEGHVVEFEGRISTKSGDTRWVHTRIAAHRSDADGTLRVVGASRDVTAQRRAEQERRDLEIHLSHVQRLDSLGVLAGGIAHDFNNLLSVILGNSSLGLADVEPDSELGRRFTRIRSAAQHAAGLTEQMLTYSGRAPFSLKSTALSRVVEDTSDLLEASVKKNGLLELELGPELPPIEGDETQLRQVVVNLVANAADAMGDAGGKVTVRTGLVEMDREQLNRSIGTLDPVPGEYVFLEVEDTGPGMDADTRERIFDPFFTTRSSGRGLGLAAVLGIVQGHRGVITLDTEPGHGATFRVLFPMAASPSTASRARARPGVEAGERPSVLIVDDDDDVREVTSEVLKRAGFDVRAVAGGREAIAILETRADSIGLVVLDLMMPDLDGEETLREIHRLQPGIPVILISGFEESLTAERFGSRIAGFLRKPYEHEELVARVQAALAPESHVAS
ncbi:MAG: PAS domain S-box protein [Myxococcota bacterium]|nr:PAS domain S-box protein [Myxococcota bacterium]